MTFFVAVSWAWFEAGQTPSLKVYLLWDLIGQLAWVRRKDSEGHLYETRHNVDNDKGGQSEGQIKGQAPGMLSSTAKIHIKTHTSNRVLQPVVFKWVSRVSPRECDDLQAVAWFSHIWLFVWRAVRWRYRAVCLMSFQVHHVNIFVYANLEAHSCQPSRWME